MRRWIKGLYSNFISIYKINAKIQSKIIPSGFQKYIKMSIYQRAFILEMHDSSTLKSQ